MNIHFKLERRKKTDMESVCAVRQARTLIQSLQKIRLPLKFFFILLAISLFSLYSFASNAAVTSNTVQSENGVLFITANGFTVENRGFLVAQKSSTASAQPIQWLNGGSCQTALITGNWFYFITLTMNANAQPNHTYSITVMWDNDSGYGSLGVLTATSPSTIMPGQTMNLFFDTGLTSFSGNTAMTITVV